LDDHIVPIYADRAAIGTPELHAPIFTRMLARKGTHKMSVTYYVALPFIRTEEGSAPGQAEECQSENAAIRKAEVMSRNEANAGALAFKRNGDPNLGTFADAIIIKSFGLVPDNLDEL
jgi:hypothetical protein